MIERDKTLFYKDAYKYNVTRDYRLKLAVVPYAPICEPFVTMDMIGNTIIRNGYAWNGASGPTWDTTNSMIGSLVHDLGYQLIRLGLIDARYKEYFDGLLREICVEDGMWQIRAEYWQWAVIKFGLGSTRPSAEPIELRAP